MSAQLLNTPDFERWMGEALLDQVYDKFQAGKSRLEVDVRDLVHPFLLESPEYQSLLSGKLRTSFGISDSKTALDEITQGVLNSTFAIVERGADFVSMTINILKDDFSELLLLENAKYYYEGRAKTLSSGRKLLGGRIEIPWLQWLLFSGDSQIISDSQVATVKTTPYSRTGKTIMISPKSSRGFQVPSEFSGVEDSNWLTRCLQPLEPNIISLILNVIQ